MSEKTKEIGRVAIVPKGTFNSSSTYTRLDVVSHDGASYMAKTDVPAGSSLTNTTYWLQVAAKGSNADTATITSAVNTWLTAHVTQPTTPAIDNTLSITGAAADAAKTGLMTAPVYSNAATYNVGDFINYNGSLYRCVSTINTAEEWNSSHWVATKIAEEVGDLKSETNPQIDIIGSPQSGYVSSDNGNIYGASSGAYSYIVGNVVGGETVLYCCGTNQTGAGIAFFDNAGAFIANSGRDGTDTVQVLIVPDNAVTVKATYQNSSYDTFKLQLLINNSKEADTFNYNILAKTVYNTTNKIVGYANVNNGNVYPNQTDYSFIKINVVAGAILQYTSGSNETVAGAVFYDKFGYFISGVAGTQAIQGIVIPDRAVYARLDLRNATESAFYACQIITQEQANNAFSNSNKNEVIVDINGNGDYTSILQALKNTPASVSIRVRKGVYNVITEFESFYGSDFFTNYTGYSGQLDPFYRGLWLGKGRKIHGESGAVILCQYDGDNANVKEYFSAIANDGDVLLENVSIMFSNVRYAIHDDYQPANSAIIWKNINFVGSPFKASVIGGGMGLNSLYFIEGCTFTGNTQDWDINYHGSNNSEISNTNTIRITNCFGSKRLGVWKNGPATTVSTCYASNNKFLEIVNYVPTGVTAPDNVALVKWCNQEGA